MILIIGLLLIGIILLVLEILVLPGMVAGVMGGVFLIAGVVWTYAYKGETAGHITLVSVIVLTSVTLYSALKSKSWNRFGLKGAIDSKVNDVSALHVEVGAEGKALSALRPSGTVLIGDKRLEAQTNGEMLDAGTEIIVNKVLPNKVIVRKKDA